MALPPGTYGWVGSGFDCTCDCTFVGGWSYDDAGANGSICMVRFVVWGLSDGCTLIPYDTATVTIDLDVNGTPITDPLIGIPDTVLPGGGAYWEKWKPVAGDVYTAVVDLDCGGGSTASRTFTITIPDPANTSCDCCAEQVPDYLIISGSTGCCTMVNGTWALSLGGGSCAFGTKNYTYTDNDIYSAPSNGCASGYCLHVTDPRGGGFPDDDWYLWPRGIQLQVVMPITGSDTVTCNVSIVFRAYRLREGTCSLQFSMFTITYIYTRNCSDGLFTYSSGGSSAVGGTAVTPCSPDTPAVSVVYV